LNGSGGGVTNVNFFSIPADVSWAPDLWQRVANTVRQFRYAAQVSAADLENTRLTQQASLAQFYFELRGQDSLQDLYDRTIAADRGLLDFARAQYETGIGPYEAVAQAEVTLETAVATAAGIAQNRALFEHAMATLIGTPASEFTMNAKVLSTPVPAVPVGLPSELLQRRPDVAAAERAMAAANAQIGVARAAFFPSLTLSSSGGFASSSLGSLLSAPSLFWSLGVTASETVFDGGLRRATVAQFEAVYRANVAAYRQTVLTAVQQVEDGLSSSRILSQQIARQEIAVSAARRFLQVATSSYETGITPYLNVLTAQNLLLADEQTLVTLRVNQMLAAVQLVQALGGGWSVKQL
jgi:NodT family efflux transporter outer membrane factor (OMF) lipoprotein